MVGFFIEQLIGLFLLIVGLRVFIGIISFSWFPSFLIKGGYDPHANRLLAKSLADCLEKRADINASLEPLISLVDHKTAGRLRTFLQEYAETYDMTSAFDVSRLFPGPQRRLIESCHENQELLIRTLNRYALSGASSRIAHSVLSNALSVLSVLLSWIVLILSFIMVIIVPKFEKIFQELAIELPPLSQDLLSVSRFIGHLGIFGFLLACVGAIVMFFLPRALSWWFHAWQPGRNRIIRGQLLLDGIALGIHETQLARMLEIPAGPNVAVLDLAEECGFRAQSVEALGCELERIEGFRTRLEEYTGILAAIGLWLGAAILVGVVVYGLFAPIVLLIGEYQV